MSGKTVLANRGAIELERKRFIAATLRGDFLRRYE